MLRGSATAGNESHTRDAFIHASALAPVLLLTFLGSISTGAVNNGIFFIAKSQYAFGPMVNSGLALLVGAAYIPSALLVGPALRRLTRRSRIVTTRRVLCALMIAMATMCAVPVLISHPAAIWVFALLYIPLMGALWPIAEAYLSGGRRSDELRRVTGWFNILWATAVAVSAWGMAPLLGLDRALGVFVGLGLIHLICVIPVLRLPSEPRSHVDDSHEPHPLRYVGLLRCFRWLLVLSYILLSALNPIMPWRLDRLGLDIGWQTPLFSTWMVSRLGMFILLRQWGGWHGRWRTPFWSGGLMLFGFLWSILAETIPGMIIGLALFGAGIGTVYAAALYYAMEVGAAEVDAGGKHEAVIGAGYTIGPALALFAFWFTTGRADSETAQPQALAILTLFVCVLFVSLAVRSARRAMRAETRNV